MRDTRLNSSAEYEADLKKYRIQLNEAVDADAIARLERWIAATEKYRDEALAQGL